MNGLKTQLTLTMIGILSFGMLLINIVNMTLWQQDVLEGEVTRLQILLDLFPRDIDMQVLEVGKKSLKIPEIVMRNDISCLRIRLAGTDIKVPERCSIEGELDSVLDEADRTGEKLVRYKGISLGVFTFCKRFLYISKPVLDNGKQIGAIALERDLAPVYKKMRQKEKTILIYMLVNVILLTVVGFFRMRKLVIRPLDRLVQLADTHPPNATFALLNEKSGSEFRRLSISLNSMLGQIQEDNKQLRITVESLENLNKELLQTRKEMIRTEKLASVGRLSAGLAHEIGNPLAIVKGYIELLGTERTADHERIQFADRAGKEVARIDELIKQLLDMSRRSNLQKSPVQVHTVLDELIGFMSDQRKNCHIEFRKQFEAANDIVIAESDSLKQIFLNCLINSIDAIIDKSGEGNGLIIVKTIIIQDANGIDQLQITIIDNGCGISKEDLENVFDPFFTKKAPGKGTGLGLSVTYTLVENIGGKIQIEGRGEGGTDVLIELPLANRTMS